MVAGIVFPAAVCAVVALVWGVAQNPNERLLVATETLADVLVSASPAISSSVVHPRTPVVPKQKDSKVSANKEAASTRPPDRTVESSGSVPSSVMSSAPEETMEESKGEDETLLAAPTTNEEEVDQEEVTPPPVDPNEPTFSFWLMLSTHHEKVVQSVIQELASQHGAVAFQPHLTLVGGVPMKMFQGPMELAEKLERITLLFFGAIHVPASDLKLSRGDKFTQAVYLEVAEGSEARAKLTEYHVKACDILGIPPKEDFMPHISLIYKNLAEYDEEIAVSEEQWASITASEERIGSSTTSRGITVDAIQVMKHPAVIETCEPVMEWKSMGYVML
jgi:2'-5' RNA ligase